jgi:hypothetical protein
MRLSSFFTDLVALLGPECFGVSPLAPMDEFLVIDL